MIRETAGIRSRVKKSRRHPDPGGPDRDDPGERQVASSASRSATQPPSELPATTTSLPDASAAASTAAAAKSTSWSSTEPGRAAAPVPKPGRS